MNEVSRILDPHPVDSLEEYRDRGGEHALRAARHRTGESVIELVGRAGLRGRGGAGFPTGRKWATIAAAAPGQPIPVVVNAAEGEPGTFKDRLLIRRNPYLVLEGACIAAHAIEADEIVVATKRSFTTEIDRLQLAIDEMADTGLTEGIDIRIVTGPGEYLFGEETALLEVIDGRPPFPRVTAPYRRGTHHTTAGDGSDTWRRLDDGPAALVDNVETFANIVGIVRHGAEWYRELGTAASPGTVICTVTGDTRRDGCGEFAMGTPLRTVIEELGGGADDQEISVVLSGVSNPPLTGAQLDTPLTYEHMSANGSGLGSCSFIVIGETTPLRAVAAGVARFLSVESCGQCEPCKRDGLALAGALTSSTEFHGVSIDDRLRTVARGARCALAGQTERVVGRLIRLADEADEAELGTDPYPITPMTDLVGSSAVFDRAHLAKRPDWTYLGGERDSGLWPAQRLADHPVTIQATQAHEAQVEALSIDSAGGDMFAPLSELHEQLETAMTKLRQAEPGHRHTALVTLRHELEQHRRATERLIYPLVSRLAPDVGDDVVFYPRRHGHDAARLLARLDLGQTPVSPRLIDELCADVHTSILELDRRVLPLLATAIGGDVAEQLLVAGDLVEEIVDSP